VIMREPLLAWPCLACESPSVLTGEPRRARGNGGRGRAFFGLIVSRCPISPIMARTGFSPS
jgi:hypothetical protein